MVSLFGTDGIRCVGDGKITPDFALKLGWAAGCFLKKYQKIKILLLEQDMGFLGICLNIQLRA